MGRTINVTIKGLPQFRRAMLRYPAISKPLINQAIKKSIGSIEDKSKPKTPVDTGALKASYRQKFSNMRGELQPGAVLPSSKYAFYVHDGTTKMSARPFLKEGVEGAQTQINKNFEKALKSTISKIATSTRI